MRHGIAFERDPHRWRDDRTRPLSAHGKARARRAATGLKRLAARPACLLTSPLLRTRQTAAILSESAGWPAATSCAQLAPGARPLALLEVLARGAQTRIAAVGHEPDLGRLLALLLHGEERLGRYRFKKMGAALVHFEGAARAGTGTLVWFAPPRLLRAVR